MRPRMLAQPIRNVVPPYVFFKDTFSKSECESIVHLAKNLQPIPAVTGSNENPSSDKTIRSSEVRWMKDLKAHRWVYDRLAKTCDDVRANWYPFNLSGFGEPIQITRYLASEGGHYDTHVDVGAGLMSVRKLSFVVLLSDPTDFTGGNFEVLEIPGADKTVKELTQGAVVAFPSWALHRVAKITGGERWSLVCWVSGPPFV